MNYVGQLAGQVFVQVKELYRGLNPATLSGCIDVIVVRQPDGSLQCSPFHVRFGKMGVLRSREKVVDMEINGEPVDLHMKLGDNGEAFFVQETENDQEVVPSYLATSPILSDEAMMSSGLLKTSGPSIQTLGSLGGGAETGLMKKRRKRRRKSRADSVRREESGDYSADEDMFSIEISSDEGAEMESSRYEIKTTEEERNWSPIQRYEHEHEGFTGGKQAVNVYLLFSSFSPGNSRPTSPKSDSELITKPSDAGGQNPAMHWAWGELPQAATPSFLPLKPEPPSVCPVSIPVTESTHFRVISHEMLEETVVTVGMEMETSRMETMETSRMECQAAGGAAARMMSDMEETMLRPLGKTDSPSKRKGTGFGSLSSLILDENSTSPTCWLFWRFLCSRLIFLHRGSLHKVLLHLYGNNAAKKEKQNFFNYLFYKQLEKHLCIFLELEGLYYNWSTAAPLVLAMQAFQKPLPKVAVENIMKEKMPKKGGRWWFSWRGRNSGSKPVSSGACGSCLTLFSDGRHKEESSSSDEDHRAAKQSSGSVQSEPGLASGGVSYKKTLRLTSEQLLSLQLQDGPNDAVFSVTTQYQGTCRCQGTIYLWNWDDKIIISDIDGTITRSDTLGHILPTLGKDWTHQGIAQLYHKVSQNGYKFLYCSARAIGMADMTRGYLHWVNERGTMLPVGPVLLSPSMLKKKQKKNFSCLFCQYLKNTVNRFLSVNFQNLYVRLGEVVDHVFPLKMRSSSSDFPCSDTFSHFTYWREQLPLVEHQGAAD
uniref:phosphatidate phosphatase n=1 Tax=Stegastes partitus TaxID=144197 RepID=A0A3B5BEB9_9TELE